MSEKLLQNIDFLPKMTSVTDGAEIKKLINLIQSILTLKIAIHLICGLIFLKTNFVASFILAKKLFFGHFFI